MFSKALIGQVWKCYHYAGHNFSQQKTSGITVIKYKVKLEEHDTYPSAGRYVGDDGFHRSLHLLNPKIILNTFEQLRYGRSNNPDSLFNNLLRPLQGNPAGTKDWHLSQDLNLSQAESN